MRRKLWIILPIFWGAICFVIMWWFVASKEDSYFTFNKINLIFAFIYIIPILIFKVFSPIYILSEGCRYLPFFKKSISTTKILWANTIVLFLWYPFLLLFFWSQFEILLQISDSSTSAYDPNFPMIPIILNR